MILGNLMTVKSKKIFLFAADTCDERNAFVQRTIGPQFQKSEKPVPVFEQAL
ncbi:MAG: hypothetical protein ACJAT0_001991 [Nonlabens sp.]|jgi:hypothetical protein